MFASIIGYILMILATVGLLFGVYDLSLIGSLSVASEIKSVLYIITGVYFFVAILTLLMGFAFIEISHNLSYVQARQSGVDNRLSTRDRHISQTMTQTEGQKVIFSSLPNTCPRCGGEMQKQGLSNWACGKCGHMA